MLIAKTEITKIPKYMLLTLLEESDSENSNKSSTAQDVERSWEVVELLWV